ncbi:MAG: hypothetical protein ACD_49C00044G0020 [uncultured bacterium (gcode 4)]|uniref:Uncharacterized protein n=1 Tax=uncultured bacterium (gcode 4) TaxID=1234023 RepID=K2BC93_9BACT|nr:MAG: hypothetical protein ACD_49C00044G0020 [uncultured bacterium (gcode 4)]
MKIWYLIYTYNRIHDAYIQMEIVKELWSKYFEDIYIIHSYNWKKEWYEKYFEDELIISENPGHFEWAANLIDIWIKKALEKDFDYIIVSASDTWIIKPEFIKEKIDIMKKEEKYLFTCPWWNPEINNPQDVWFATDFFIIDAKWEKKNGVFPFNYAIFREKYLDLLRYLWKGSVMVEKLFFSNLLNAFTKHTNENNLKKYALSKILMFTERMPAHSDILWNRTSTFPEIWLYMNHEIKEKQKIFNDLNLDFWKYSMKLRNWEFLNK